MSNIDPTIFQESHTNGLRKAVLFAYNPAVSHGVQFLDNAPKKKLFWKRTSGAYGSSLEEADDSQQMPIHRRSNTLPFHTRDIKGSRSIPSEE